MTLGRQINNGMTAAMGPEIVAVLGAGFFLLLIFGWLKSAASDDGCGGGCLTTVFVWTMVGLAFVSLLGLGG